MESLLISGLTIAGKEILYKLIMETCGLINKKEQHNKVKNALTELDLKANLILIQSLVKQTEIAEDKENVADVVDVALSNVKEMIEIIKKELETIQKIDDSHKNSYLAYFLTPPFYQNLENLNRNNTILNHRVDFLIKVLTLKHINTTISNIPNIRYNKTTLGLIADLTNLSKSNSINTVSKSFFDDDV